MKKASLILTLFLCSLQGFSQSYGNEWIDYSQSYYKMDITEDGIHQIDFNTLVSSGIPIQSIDPRNLQIFAKEKEIPILIYGEEDGIFDEEDIIEFAAFHNDGWLDSLIYINPDGLNNPYYSMFNDTLHYFITWNDELDNERIDIIDDTNFDSYPNVEYIWKESRKMYTNQYWGGAPIGLGILASGYEDTEGWFSSFVGFPWGQITSSYDIPHPNIALGGSIPDVQLKTVSSSRNNPESEGEFNHHLQIELNNSTLIDSLYSGYQLNKFYFNLPVSLFEGESTTLSHKVIDDLNLEADYVVVSWINLRYPHLLTTDDDSELYFEVPNTNNQLHLSLQNVSNTNGVIYTLGANQKKIIPQFTNQQLDAIIENNTNNDSKCLLTYPENIHTINVLTPVTDNAHFTDFGSLVLDSAFVIVTHHKLWSSAQMYADYRANDERESIIVNIEELYDQYGGGIVHHEIAIRRFTNHILNHWDDPPAHLFLLGKSIRNFQCRTNSTNFSNNLVPSFGYPPSDNLITSGLNGTLLEPAIPTGRISAITNDQVEDYLNKVVTFENQEPAEWMKHVMHFGGGSNSNEQLLFANYLNGYTNTIEDSLFGGQVHTFLKNSSLPIEVVLSDSISDRIADGTSIMTFFGHATGSSFDYSIDNPENLEWNGHYPLFIANSCYSGNIHTSSQNSTSEQFTLLPDKGAIGFVSSVHLGFTTGLNSFASELYREISTDSYGKSVGDQIQYSIRDIQGENPSPVIKSTCEGITLQGDPSIVMNAHDKPDISIDNTDINITENELNILVDSIHVHVTLTNIGKATTEEFEVELIRHFPNGQPDSIYSQVIEGLYFKDTISFTLPLDFSHTIGVNTLEVNVDLPSNTLDELDDFGNNTASISILVAEGSVLPGYPYNFSIVGENNITLKASTGNPFDEEKNYRFEIDTSPDYDSPVFQSTVINQSGGVLNWELPFILTDSTVYYWRVSIDSTATEDYQWQESSFQYIEGEEGWSQADFHQFESNNITHLIGNTLAEEYAFLTGSKELKCSVTGNSVSSQNSSEYRIDGELMEYGGCTNTPALHVAIIDPLTLDPWETNFQGQNPDHDFGQLNQGFAPCRSRAERYFIFRPNIPTHMDSLQSLLNNKIPEGHYLLIYTWRYAQYSQWNNNAPWLFDKFVELGATEIGLGEDQRPFIFLTKIGSPESSQEVMGETSEAYIELYYDLELSGDNGRMRSTIIGPAYTWDRLWWNSHSLESPSNDQTYIKLKGITENGAEVDIPLAVFDGDQSLEINLNDYINPSTYPYLKLQSIFKDSITQSPAQIDAWHVNYGVAPETAINPQIGFTFHSDTLLEGATMRFSVAIENISKWDMDSLKVNYWVEDKNQNIHPIPYSRQDSLRAGDHLIDTIYFNTTGFIGVNKFWIEVNPFNDSLQRFDQKEQYHFNNIAHIPFVVTGDNVNPILDVVFDGIHILDGELVSTKPFIQISLDDENPFLLMNEPSDTAFFNVFLTNPEGIQKRINFEENDEYSLVFIPANGSNNISKLEYKPNLVLDGQYQLLVIASDKSGNASGDLNYTINFTIDHESYISEVLNYPNPFSTKTQFVFTLSGEAVPDYMKIQIMTITGRIVKTIYKEELGNIRIGRNITDYAWDGKDDFGDPLANGVYLYRVTIKYQGEDMEYRQTSAKKYFKEGLGKMYLMR